MKRVHAMPFGAVPDCRGGARFRLWAPDAERVERAREGAALDAASLPLQAFSGG